MRTPYLSASAAFDAREILSENSSALRRPANPDTSHPLTRIDRIVEGVCAQGADSDRDSPFHRMVVRVIRAAILQSLYSFDRNILLLEQLRYHTLYRWFVGLHDGELPWSSTAYADALGALMESAESVAMLRRSMIGAQACAALCPERFAVDREMIAHWTTYKHSPYSHQSSPASAAQDSHHARFERARGIIARRIGDLDLTAESIAAEMCMSRRALFLLFERQGLTPSRVIRDMRLDHCRSLLTDSQNRQRKVTDIAMDFGFTYAGNFSRQFKDRFGVTPIEVRMGVKASPTALNE